MKLTAIAATLSEILPWRDRYRREMNCQIVHDSLHTREGWTVPHLLHLDDRAFGYATIAVGGPWHGTRTLFEFFIEPAQRAHLFDAFAVAVAATRANALLWQTNDPLLHPPAQTSARNGRTSKLVFADQRETAHACPGATFRRVTAADMVRIFPHVAEPVGDWLIELDGAIAATGGFLSHYNPPFADLYLEVSPAFRRRGVGRFLLQELKRECRHAGYTPCARCSPENIGSQKTCQSAGLLPIAEILEADLPRAETMAQ